MAEKNESWQNQNQFLQDRHGLDKAFSLPEIIAVGLPYGDDQAFDLLCWTINMAARPGDAVVALRQQQYEDTMQRFIAGNVYKPQSVRGCFKPLQDLCDVKQVRLELRVASTDVGEKLLFEEVLEMNATMLVVTNSGHNARRHAHRRGSYLCRQVPAGCSIVVVKDYKILCYKKNKFRAGLVKGHPSSADGAPSLQFHPTPVKVRKADAESQPVGTLSLCKETYQSAEECSPSRALDSSDAFCDSDGSPSLSDLSGRTSLLSKMPSFSCGTSSLQEEDVTSTRQPHSCLSIWRKGSDVQLSRTFASLHRPGHAVLSAYCKSLKNALKAFLSSLWIARPSKQGCKSKLFIQSNLSWRVFTYKEISKATNHFSQGNLVGKGGHSEVYKGVLPDGESVAVKRLFWGNTEEEKTINFLTELGMICHIHHPNIIPMVGYCIENGLHLIYHYLSNGNLASWIYGGQSPALTWGIRFKVAIGTARGLKYLHYDCQRRIIHRDIKASNILLGEDFEPQISDFGLAKWLPDQCSHQVLSPIEGTFGYLAPEYVMNGVLDEKTDVFAFGVLLLELVTGRKPIEGLELSLVMWARPLLESMSSVELVDGRLHGDYNQQELQCMMMTAALCVQPSPQCRPCMTQVLQLLTDEVSSDGAGSFSVVSSQSFCRQDGTFESDYSSTNYQEDLHRHREIALEF